MEAVERSYPALNPQKEPVSQGVGVPRFQGRYEKTLTAFKERVVKELGDHLSAIVVYGSVARGKAAEHSDIDILILGRAKEIRSKASEIAYEIDYENNFETFITPIYLTRDEFEHRVKVGSPFIYEVLRDGTPLYDDGAFERVREKVLGVSR